MPPYQLLVTVNQKQKVNKQPVLLKVSLPTAETFFISQIHIFFAVFPFASHGNLLFKKTYSNPQKDRTNASRMVVP